MAKVATVFTLLTIILFQACKPPEQAPKKDHQPLMVSTSKVTRKDMVDSVKIYGVIELRNEVLVASQFDGRLKDFSLMRGDQLKKGQKK